MTEWISLSSSNIQQVKYDPRLQLLWVQFHGRAYDGTGEYIFDGVPPDVFESLCSAESAGKYFRKHIEGHFKMSKGMRI